MKQINKALKPERNLVFQNKFFKKEKKENQFYFVEYSSKKENKLLIITFYKNGEQKKEYWSYATFNNNNIFIELKKIPFIPNHAFFKNYLKEQKILEKKIEKLKTKQNEKTDDYDNWGDIKW